MHRFTNPDDERVNLADWRKDYNEVRPHSRDRQQGADIAAEWFIGSPADMSVPGNSNTGWSIFLERGNSRRETLPVLTRTNSLDG